MYFLLVWSKPYQEVGDTMRCYLTYDAHCPLCTHLAEVVQEASGDRVETLALDDPGTRELLDRAFPKGWPSGSLPRAREGARLDGDDLRAPLRWWVLARLGLCGTRAAGTASTCLPDTGRLLRRLCPGAGS